jgi:hypothetical protein
MAIRAVCIPFIVVLTACMTTPSTGTDLTVSTGQIVTPQHTTESTPETIEVMTPTPVENLAMATYEPPPGAIGPDDFPANVNPLTGQMVADPAVLERRPLVVKISNAPPLVRPQSGIGAADLVFEHYAEGGLTRFSAVFYSQAPTRVGSIRSARLIDYELVPMYQGLLAFSGASLGVEKRIYGSEAVKQTLCGAKTDPAEKQQCEVEADAIAPPGLIPPSEFADRALKGVLYGAPYYWRDESIPVPHNMFTNTAALWELAAQNGFGQRPNLTGMTFHPDPAVDETALVGPGTTLDVRYRATQVQWTYDAAIGRYRRFADGAVHADANTGEQITADNVVVLYTGHYLTDIIESVWQDSVSYSIQNTVWPEGDAILLRDGQRYDGRWIRAVREDLISLETVDGEPLYLKPGNTWFQLVPLPEQMDSTVEWVNVG